MPQSLSYALTEIPGVPGKPSPTATGINIYGDFSSECAQKKKKRGVNLLVKKLEESKMTAEVFFGIAQSPNPHPKATKIIQLLHFVFRLERFRPVQAAAGLWDAE